MWFPTGADSPSQRGILVNFDQQKSALSDRLRGVIPSNPLTVEQLKQLAEDFSQVQHQVNNIEILLNAVYGDRDERALRAALVADALTRLKWAMERGDQKSESAAA